MLYEDFRTYIDAIPSLQKNINPCPNNAQMQDSLKVNSKVMNIKIRTNQLFLENPPKTN